MLSFVNGLRKINWLRSANSAQPFSFQVNKRSFSSKPGALDLLNLLTSTPWDTNNRIRVGAAALGAIGTLGLVFDTFYNRATKEELKDVEIRLEAKVDALDKKVEAKVDALERKVEAKVDALERKVEARMDASDRKMDVLGGKIDALAIALLGVEQREKISYREENTYLKKQIDFSRAQLDQK
jgi:hypothetical protein